jgi:hypothetical protein
MSDSEPNVALRPNVMTVTERMHDEIAHLPGDFAVQIYRIWWTSPESIRTNLTERQFIEYEQHMVCLRCRRPCAGTCEPSTRALITYEGSDATSAR